MFTIALKLVGTVCMMTSLVLPVRAAEGTVRVRPVWGGGQVSGGEVILSRVGERTGTGCRITDGLADWIISEQELLSGDWTDLILQQETDPMYWAAAGNDGVLFRDLPEGVYLVQQRKAAPGFMAFHPFLLCIPEGEQWDVTREVALVRDEAPPETGDRHVPLVGAMGIGLSAAVLMVLADQRKK